MKHLQSDLWHHLTEEDVFNTINSDRLSGLSHNEVQERLRLFGPNTISGQASISPLKRLLLQFHNPLIYILLFATAVTLFLGEYVDSGVIFGVVLINAAIGFVQESKAEEAINSLKGMLSSTATVLRDGEKQTIPASDVVPGDIVFLASGDKVPADMRIFDCRDLQIDESTLTGESVSATKSRTTLGKETVLADRENMAFAGTLVTYGGGKGVITATGDHTETGKIADMIAQATSIDTPLTRKIHQFSKLLLWVILALAGVTFGVGLLYGLEASETFMAAVALAVAAIPEGLPAVVTITLAIGVQRMAKRNAIIRTLSAVETLGSTTVICSDKTGTLTENQMTVQKIFSGGGDYTVSGTGYQPQGELSTLDGTAFQLSDNLALTHCLRAGLVSNDSKLIEKEKRWTVQGDPTEGSLIACAFKAGLDLKTCENAFPRIDTIPFESDRQYMATLHEDQECNRLYLKGSVEQVMARCKTMMDADGQLQPLNTEIITDHINSFAAAGLRVLAFAMEELPKDETSLDAFNQREPNQALIFLGLQAMIDPPRQEAIHAVATCHKAGINVKMITGDHALTAKAIATKIGIIRDSNSNGQVVLTGKELSEMSDHKLLECAETVSVFARVAPEQKLKLVTALQAKGHVVAMTGDGVNDAPALKQADIGIAMGISGTEVSKEASDMVLTDDNFSSIEAAVEEGRNVFDNLLKFITWILPTNLGQGLVIMVAILFGVTLPVLPVQALWLNMTTAVFLGLMLAFEPKEPGIMQRIPRSPDAPLLSIEIIYRIFSVSTLLLIGAFGLFKWSQSMGASIEESRTLAVTLFVIVQSFFLLNCRSMTQSIFTTPMSSNLWIWGGISAMLISQLLFIYTPLMNTLFQSAPLSLNQWLLMLAYGACVLCLVEVEKAFWRKRTLKTSSECVK
ncbi:MULTISPECIES: cation-transporting P-type ATPase [Nitrincola]|uniref:Putative cation-transporting ATPase F n=1 Tax=Nitrincola nitratireducens TaxID=1229521 RepID=W9V3A6_9GAMM|nr:MULTISPECIES: cation-transporting P-type ATPase [Nitrincola]EXJ11416.1 putative cation-transporting ATPase F [Nitrincola nitratireducens]